MYVYIKSKHMLSKRTNILFSNEMWDQLNDLAKEKKESIGEIVRSAVDEIYFSHKKDEEIRDAFETILQGRPAIEKRIDYKELINEGRKD